MSLPRDWLNELRGLLDELEDGDFTELDRLRLNELLRCGTEPQDFFIAYREINGGLMWDGRLGLDPGQPSVGGRHESPLADELCGLPPPAPPSPAVTALGSPGVWKGFADYFCQPGLSSVTLLYAIGVLVCGLLVVAALLRPSVRPADVATRQQQAVGEKPRSREQSQRVRNQSPAPANRKADPAGDSTSGWSRTLRSGDHLSMESLVGKNISTEAGVGGGQIAYNPGTSVSLEGPFSYSVPTATSGAMHYGRSTVRVEKGYNFALSLPSIQLTCRGGEFGVELDRKGDGWIQVFAGTAAMQLLDKGGEATRMSRTISLGENESVRFRQSNGACVATVIRDAQLAVELAGRMPPRLRPQNGGKEPTQVASAEKQDAVALPGNALPRAAQTGDNSSLLLVSTQDSPFDPARPTNQIVTARFTLSQVAPHDKPQDLVPGRILLRLRFAVRRFVICAMRLNGNNVPLPEEPLAGTVRQIGAVTLPDGFLGGNGVNVVEFDVRSLEPGQVLPAELRGTDGPIVVTAEIILVPRAQQAK